MTIKPRDIPEPPETLGELMRIAIKDGREMDPKLYVPYSGTYYAVGDIATGSGDKRCHACFAGGVLAGTLDVPIGVRFNMGPFDWHHMWAMSDRVRCNDDGDEIMLRADKWKDSLYSLDYIRQGEYMFAAAEFYGFTIADTVDMRNELRRWPRHRPYFYGEDLFASFLDAMERIAEHFEEVGL